MMIANCIEGKNRMEKTINWCLIEAIRIMDEKGRRAIDHKSIILWEKEWDNLRTQLIDALFLANDPQK